MKYIKSETVELKSEFVERIKLEIPPFVNTNGGIIYVGVEDNGNVIGISKRKYDELSNTISS